MRSLILVFVLIGAAATPLLASDAPEIDSYSAAAAVGVVGAAAVLIRSRKRNNRR
jgi:hypothetical protein